MPRGHVRRNRARRKRRPQARRAVHAVDAKTAPVTAVPVPGDEVPAATEVGQAQRFHPSLARLARVAAVREGQRAAIAAGGGQGLQQAGIRQRRAGAQRQRHRVQRTAAPAQARGHQLVQLGQQCQGRVFEATHVGAGGAQCEGQRHRFIVVEHQRRQFGAAAERVAAAHARGRLHRIAQLTQAIDIAAHGARVHTQFRSERRPGPVPPRLQQAGQSQQPGGGRQHAGSLSRTETVRNAD